MENGQESCGRTGAIICGAREVTLDRLTLVYGMRLVGEGEVAAVEHGQVLMDDGQTRQVTLHTIEGTKTQIKNQLLESIDAFFDIHS